MSMWVLLLSLCMVAWSGGRASDSNGDIISLIRNVERRVKSVEDKIENLTIGWKDGIQKVEVKLHDEIDEKFGEARQKWQLQATNVCFGAKDDAFGSFKLNKEGRVSAIKLVHRSGFVSCVSNIDHGVRHSIDRYKSNWGCGSWWGKHEILLIITDELNREIFPKSTLESSNQWYTLLGYHGESNVLVLSNYATPMYGTLGLELRIWYSEDLMKISAGDNIGVSCTDVYVMFD